MAARVGRRSLFDSHLCSLVMTSSAGVYKHRRPWWGDRVGQGLNGLEGKKLGDFGGFGGACKWLEGLWGGAWAIKKMVIGCDGLGDFGAIG